MPIRSLLKSLICAIALLGITLAPAEARRGGSFGSRGTRTYSAPSSTSLTPGYTAPVQRSMTSRSVTPSYAPSYQPNYYQQRRPGIFGGFGGGLLTGVIAGGLIGHFLGHGYGYGTGGGGGGFLATLIQLAILGGIIWLVFRLFSGRSGGASYSAAPPYQEPYQPAYAPQPAYGAAPQVEFQITGADQETFERLLAQLQDAFGREDYGALRAVTTPEMMGYLAEELSDNATHGRRNEVTGTRLLDGEVSEAWSENGQDYATVAMRYESADLMRDRTTGAILSGSATPSQTTELWTFVRNSGDWAGWKVSAIQEA